MNLKGIEYQVVGWIHLAQGSYQLAGFCEHDNRPSVPTKGDKFFD
jgi:hypothetical protein